MGKVKEAIMAIEDMFNEEFEKFQKMIADSLEDFRKNGATKEDVESEIQMATCEGKLQAYARVAKELLGNESLEEKYDAAVEKFANDAMEIVGITADEMGEEDDEDEDENDFDKMFNKLFEDHNKLFEDYKSRLKS
jgi:hypothetical protein